jgi:hypothetical protein
MPTRKPDPPSPPDEPQPEEEAPLDPAALALTQAAQAVRQAGRDVAQGEAALDECRGQLLRAIAEDEAIKAALKRGYLPIGDPALSQSAHQLAQTSRAYQDATCALEAARMRLQTRQREALDVEAAAQQSAEAQWLAQQAPDLVARRQAVHAAVDRWRATIAREAGRALPWDLTRSTALVMQSASMRGWDKGILAQLQQHLEAVRQVEQEVQDALAARSPLAAS